MPQNYDDFLSLFGQNRYIQAGVLLLLSAAVAKLLDLLISRSLTAWARRSDTELDDRLFKLLHRPLFVSVFLAGLWLATLRLDLADAYTTLILRVFKTLALLVWLIFAMRASSIILEVLSGLKERVAVIQPRTLSLFDTTIKILLVGSGLYFFFLSWGIDVGGLLLSGGIIGIAVGFAAKDTLANLFSGFFILADAPYQVGDFVVLDSGERGRVTQVGLRSTRLLTRDDIEITIPNAVIANAKIINESGGPSEKERIRIKVGVAYGSDLDHVRQVLMDIASSHPDIDNHPEPRVRFRSFGESSLELELLGWIHEPVLRGRVLDALNSQVYKRFAEEGIEIPFPKRDVYLREVASSGDG